MMQEVQDKEQPQYSSSEASDDEEEEEEDIRDLEGRIYTKMGREVRSKQRRDVGCSMEPIT